MKWPILPAVALSILFVNLQAQQPGASPQQPGTSAHSTKVLTGCLRAGPAADTFTLRNATPKVDPNDLAGPAVGTSGEKMEYGLAADTGLDHSGPPDTFCPVSSPPYAEREADGRRGQAC